MADDLRLLHLLHLASPALPIGAFHFSQGLEYAVHAGWVHDESSARSWIDGLAGTLASLDLPILCRLHAAWHASDAAALQRWNAVVLASRETAELRAEERHLGTALAKVLRELGVSVPAADNSQGYVATFALACTSWSIALPQALQTYAWVWLENQVLAAVKLVPLGQSAGQRILHALMPRMAQVAAHATQVADHDIGTSALMQIVASSCHETQYSRLFRS